MCWFILHPDGRKKRAKKGRGLMPNVAFGSNIQQGSHQYGMTESKDRENPSKRKGRPLFSVKST